MSYSTFINGLKLAGNGLDRKLPSPISLPTTLRASLPSPSRPRQH